MYNVNRPTEEEAINSNGSEIKPHHYIQYAKLIDALFRVAQILYQWRYSDKPPGVKEIFKL